MIFLLFQKKPTDKDKQRSSTLDAHPHQLRIFYGTQTSTANLFAEQLSGEAKRRGIAVSLADLKDCDPEECLTQQVLIRSCENVNLRDSLRVKFSLRWPLLPNLGYRIQVLFGQTLHFCRLPVQLLQGNRILVYG